MFGIFARAMIGVTASDSPELVGPQIVWTRVWLIMSCVAFTALVGSPCVSRVMISILRPLTPPAALIVSAAYNTPRLKPMAGAEEAPVIEASQPILIGSAWALASPGKPSDAALSPPAEPNTNFRREMLMPSSGVHVLPCPAVAAGRHLILLGFRHQSADW